ncbi:MAG: hypothetical protein IT371_23185 [Deltaproteobacteria bacterium]|nr:hypothetical protein [Deltaproteobacteria bacterium]
MRFLGIALGLAVVAQGSLELSARAEGSCGKGGASGESQQNLGQSYYKVSTPPGYDGTKAVPLWLVLHGDEGSPSTVYPKFFALQQQRGGDFLLVTPKAYLDGGSWWHTPDPHIAFLDQVLAKVLADYNVDKDRIYLAGFSGGGSLSTRYGVERQDQFAGMLLLAGGSLGTSYKPPAGSCKIPARYVMGDVDSLRSINKAHYTLLQGKGHDVVWVTLPGTGHEWQKLLAETVLDEAWAWMKSKTMCGTTKAGPCGGGGTADSGVPPVRVDSGSPPTKSDAGIGRADLGPVGFSDGAPTGKPAAASPRAMLGGCEVGRAEALPAPTAAALLLAVGILLRRSRRRRR